MDKDRANNSAVTWILTTEYVPEEILYNRLGELMKGFTWFRTCLMNQTLSKRTITRWYPKMDESQRELLFTTQLIPDSIYQRERNKYKEEIKLNINYSSLQDLRNITEMDVEKGENDRGCIFGYSSPQLNYEGKLILYGLPKIRQLLKSSLSVMGGGNPWSIRKLRRENVCEVSNGYVTGWKENMEVIKEGVMLWRALL